MYLHHFNEENPNKVRGLMPFMDNDPSYKELYDKGIDVKKLTEKALNQYSFYEETPFPDVEKYRHIK